MQADIIVIPFLKQKLSLVMRLKPSQSIISCPLSSSSQYGWTALIRASRSGQTSVVEKLLAAGADPNHQNKVRFLVTKVMLVHVPNEFILIEVLHLFLGQ